MNDLIIVIEIETHYQLLYYNISTSFVKMNCKFCNSPKTMKYGFKAGTQYYKCNACGRKFAGTPVPEGMRFPTTTIGETLGLFYDGLSVVDISRHLVATEGILLTLHCLALDNEILKASR
jgi:transposase-like protein